MFAEPYPIGRHNFLQREIFGLFVFSALQSSWHTAKRKSLWLSPKAFSLSGRPRYLSGQLPCREDRISYADPLKGLYKQKAFTCCAGFPAFSIFRFASQLASYK
jgi:hypothetical protein